jgi:hypothetical protein
MSNIVLEERTIMQSVTINPGPINTKITPDNLFVLSNTKYEVAMNLFNSLNQTDYIRIRFPLSWSLYENSCKLITGFVMNYNQTLQCDNYTDGTYRYLNVTNFIEAPRARQQVMAINLTTPAAVPAAPGYEI